ncbi:DUF881 domain-containing protein [Nocardioides sp. P86]|uniref:DUF881 domain-containing protein n=1 Tax=Nocardioides sp. P86 TaxID=2939569 RepID=UPI002041DDD8|nr:DUF881 domain-containing protein [Nocardioides sp. P86]MCM3516479.1 DUF881 domain-containing protein [Nocardioides sp. P86]
MTPTSHAAPPQPPDPSGPSGHRGPQDGSGAVAGWHRVAASLRARRRPGAGRPLAWRVGTPLVVLLSGSLFVISAQSSEGTDLRPGRYTDLSSLVGAEADRYDELRQRVQDLTGEVATLGAQVGDADTRRVQERIETLRDPAGLEPREGAGVSVTLADAPLEVAQVTEQPLELLVVHQQDIQAVVNAMWRGGATAVTVAGQRVVSTTGIKCEGNSVLLQNVPYPQPYVIEAVGDPSALAASIEGDDYLARYRAQSELPDVQIGWDFAAESDVVAPAFDGLLDLSYAEPLEG